MLTIYIPSMARAGRQHTLAGLPAALRGNTYLVVSAQERAVYAQANPEAQLLAVPSSVQGIADTRQWILEHAYKAGLKKIVMLDDDLTFARRRTDNPSLFTLCTPATALPMFTALERALDKYTHAGVLAREGGNRVTEPFKLCMRMMRVYAYNVPALRQAKVRYTSGLVMDDFDMILQLLRKGHPNYVLCQYVQNQPGSNTSGGASVYRTPEVTKATVDKLVKLHAPFVKAVQKYTKTSWGGNATRWDVVVQWKQAYLSSGVEA